MRNYERLGVAFDASSEGVFRNQEWRLAVSMRGGEVSLKGCRTFLLCNVVTLCWYTFMFSFITLTVSISYSWGRWLRVRLTPWAKMFPGTRVAPWCVDIRVRGESEELPYVFALSCSVYVSHTIYVFFSRDSQCFLLVPFHWIRCFERRLQEVGMASCRVFSWNYVFAVFLEGNITLCVWRAV